MNGGDFQYFEATSLEDAWRELIFTWISQQSGLKANAIITPNASTIQALKRKLVAANLKVFNLNFTTPSVLLKKLANFLNISTPLALRADLHLILRLLADDLDNEDLLNSISAEPESYLQAYDSLVAAGRTATAFPHKTLQRLTKKLNHQLSTQNLQTVQQLEQALMNTDPVEHNLFENVLIYGFSSANWGQFPLLQAVSKFSTTTTLCFIPEQSLSTYEKAWQGTWEEQATPVHRVFEDTSLKPFANLAKSFGFPNFLPLHNKTNLNLNYLVGQTIHDESQAVVAQTLRYLYESTDLTLGIVVSSQSSSLAREISSLLAEQDITFFDNIGHHAAKPQQRVMLEGWLTYQKRQTLDNFFQFLNLLLEHKQISPLDNRRTKKACTDAFQSLMTDDLNIIFSSILTDKIPGAAEIIQEWQLLPETITPDNFWKITSPVLKQFKWPEDFEGLHERFLFHKIHFNRLISSELLLQWLDSVTNESGRLRYPSGSHPYSKIHLITAEEAKCQSWSHLIITELNQIHWPSVGQPNPFLDDATIDALNNEIIYTGSKGPGQTAIDPKFSLLTSSTQRTQQSKNTFQLLLSLPSQALTLSTHLRNPLDGKPTAPGEFLEILYWLCSGELLTEEHLLRLQEQSPKLPELKKRASRSFERMLLAYRTRRDRTAPFNEYSFSLKTPLKDGINLSCKSWEEAIQSPSATFFKHVLGVNKEDLFATKSGNVFAVGTWVHDWLDSPSKPNFAESKNKAMRLRKRIFALYNALNKKVPSWWDAYWKEAQKISNDLITNLKISEKNFQWHAEYTLPHKSSADIRDIINMPLSGRIDLLLIEKHLANSENHLWIIDYKTGPKGALSKRKFTKGHGLQLALYALAFHHKGYDNITLSILEPNRALKAQLTLSDILESEPLLQSIQTIQSKGIFGQRGPVSSQYQASHERFPIATLQIKQETLEHKWALTHPNIPF